MTDAHDEMAKVDEKQVSIAPWRLYIITTLEAILAYFLATFSLGLYFSHLSDAWIITSIIMGILYVFVMILLLKRVIQKVSLAAFMLIIPIAPLLALITVLVLIPLLQLLH